MYDPYGRLMRVVLSPTSPTTQSWSEQWREYDVAGNVSYAAEARIGPNPLFGGDPEEVHCRTTRYYYSADKRLVRSQRFARDRFMEMGGNSDDLIEEIRYDALGRRIMVRTRHAPSGALGKSDAITRFVWDGDQLLGELRAPGGEGDNLEAAYGSGKQYGRVSYVHGGDIDRPLGVYRNNFNHLGATTLIVPYVNWRGQYERGSFIGGAPECTGSNSNCIYVDWPAPQLRTYLDRPGGGEGDWVGSLLQDQLDESGLLYRRNRYYDPNTGQFTQKDPIGIAGGLNLYGFADGDPVTYSDPFGLRACDPPDAPCPILSEAGEEATEFWAERFNNADNFGEKVFTGLMGGLSALWTPETAEETGMTLIGASLGSVAQTVSRLPAARALLNNRTLGSADGIAVNLKFNPSERSLNIIAGGKRVFDLGVHAIGKSILGPGRQVPHVGIGANAGKHTIHKVLGNIRFIR